MNLKPFVYKTGKSLSEIKKVSKRAIAESQALGLENDELFVESVLVTMLEMDETEYIECIRKLNKQFVESKYASFDNFMESLLNEDGVAVGAGMVSTGFAPSSRPESINGVNTITPKKKKKEDDEEGQ